MQVLSIATPCRLFVSAAIALVATGCKSPQPISSGLRNTEPTPVEAGQVGGDWAKFCAGGATVADPVMPRYDDADMMKAAKILSVVNKESYYLYSDVLAKHSTALPDDVAAQGITKEAHNFLGYLCGEFRDHAPMLLAKLNWIFNMRYLNSAPAGDSYVSCEDLNNPLLGTGTAAVKPYDPKGSPWKQMCVGDYDRYVDFSDNVFSYREQLLKGHAEGGFTYEDGTVASGPLMIGQSRVDRYVPGYTVCETKYIFSEYIKRQKGFRDGSENAAQAYKRFTDGYAAFKASCDPDDLEHYYDFRGDSNFKPNSPESNGMIWFSRTMARHCETRVKARVGSAVTDADCQRYYEAPFKSRYAAARAGLGAWMLHAAEHEAAMNSYKGIQFNVVQHQVGNPSDLFGDKGPYLFRLNDTFSGDGRKIETVGQAGTFFPGYESLWNESDMGLSQLSGVTGTAQAEFLFRRLNNAVDRHTDWYRAGFDSAPNLSPEDKNRMMNSQAYSPFVASSYEMSKSNGFTGCGVTIRCNGRPDFDQHKHWMFIFKIKKSNWTKPEDLLAGTTKLDFDRMWFDETSFGDSGLANEERAWDRLGSPTESEYAEILYLYRIPN